jgi:hypothetical protein
LPEFAEEAGAAAIVRSLRSRKILIPNDAVAYKLRNQIECFSQAFRIHSHTLRSTRGPFPNRPLSRQPDDLDALIADSS